MTEEGPGFSSATSSAITSESDQHAPGRSRVLESRAHRHRRIIGRAVESGEIMDDFSFLEQTTVQSKTAKKYRTALRHWELAPDLDLDEDAAVNASVVAHMNDMFLCGEQPNLGEVLMAGILWKWPEFGRYGRRKLLRLWRPLKGGRRRVLAGNWRPHALAMWCGIPWEMCREGAWIMAVYLMLVLSTDMKPSAPLLILQKDLAAPVP